MTWSKSPNPFGEEEREDSWRKAGGEREVGDTILVYKPQKRHCANKGYQRRTIVMSPSTPDIQGQSHSLRKTVVETPVMRKQGRGAEQLLVCCLTWPLWVVNLFLWLGMLWRYHTRVTDCLPPLLPFCFMGFYF